MLALAWPLILTNIAQILINATDVYLLAKLGPDALAASAMGSGLVVAMMLFGIGLVLASSPMIASEMGRRRNSVRDVRRTVRQAMWAAVSITLPLWALLWFTGPLMQIAGQPARLANDTGIFVRALQWEILPALLTVVLRSFIAALERPIWTLIVGIGGVLVNALVNWSLIFGHFGFPPLGLRGAGIGSSLTSLAVFGAMVLVVTRQRHFRRYHLLGRFWRADWPRFRAIWRLGLPISLGLGFEATVFAAAVFLMGYISTAAVAANAVAFQVVSMTFMVPMGIAQAATVRVGLAYGRRDVTGVGQAGWCAYAIGVGFMAVMGMVIAAFPRPLAGLFLDAARPDNAPVLDMAVGFLGIAAIFQIVDGAQVVGTGMLRGLHDTRVPMIFSFVGYWGIGIGVGALLAFKVGMGGVGIWIGLTVGLAIVAILLLARWSARGRLGLVPQ
jgi:multidrug resistance protein, MATE family